VIVIAPDAQVSALAEIEESVRGTRIEIGPRTVIDSFVKIKPVGGSADVVIGAHCFLNSGTVVYSGNGVTLGDHVLVAANCTLAPVNHEYRYRDGSMHEGFLPSKGGIHIGNGVWLGANTVVLDGARIGEGCVVGAGSVVIGELEPYGIYHGSPARPAGQRR
jgi:virginiamycin A acetyltransferase